MSLDPEQIANLLAKDKEKAPRKGGGGGKRKDTTAERSYDNWWKQPQVFGDCENEGCEDPRPNKRPGLTMVAPVKGMNLCRYCFLGGVNDGTDPA